MSLIYLLLPLLGVVWRVLKKHWLNEQMNLISRGQVTSGNDCLGDSEDKQKANTQQSS